MSAEGSSGRRIVVLGGTSEIALAIVRALLAAEPRQVVLVGRDRDGLETAAEGLRRDGAEHASIVLSDALDTDGHEAAIAEAVGRLGGVADLIVLAVGLLGERGGMPASHEDALAVLRVNLVGAGSLALRAAERLRRQRSGTLVVLSSVAGERVRASNLVYGAAKAGLDGLAAGLGDALRRDGVRVLVVRPGFVHTRMTRGRPAAPLASTPEQVAAATRARTRPGRGGRLGAPGATLDHARPADASSPRVPGPAHMSLSSQQPRLDPDRAPRAAVPAACSGAHSVAAVPCAGSTSSSGSSPGGSCCSQPRGWRWRRSSPSSCSSPPAPPSLVARVRVRRSGGGRGRGRFSVRRR